MQAQDIRAGNIVKLSHGIDVFIVKGIKPVKDTTELQLIIKQLNVFGQNDIDWPLHCFSGIDITGEWLERFGFKKDYKFYRLNDFEIELNPHPIYMMGNEPVYIKHLNDLQNFFYFLKRKELKLIR